jgi:hypothetical protein
VLLQETSFGRTILSCVSFLDRSEQCDGTDESRSKSHLAGRNVYCRPGVSIQTSSASSVLDPQLAIVPSGTTGSVRRKIFPCCKQDEVAHPALRTGLFEDLDASRREKKDKTPMTGRKASEPAAGAGTRLLSLVRVPMCSLFHIGSLRHVATEQSGMNGSKLPLAKAVSLSVRRLMFDASEKEPI